jgi:hypothetical protein
MHQHRGERIERVHIVDEHRGEPAAGTDLLGELT